MAATISASGISFSHRPPIDKSSEGRKAFHEGGHYLEKLEFALAVAETRGDQIRSEKLRDEIAALGGNIEEPGT